MAIFEDAERFSMPKTRVTKPTKSMYDTNRFDEDPWEFLHDPDTILENKTNITPTTHAARANGDENDIALPTPICATYPCTIRSADGREATIYTPIDGFEHLFKPRHDSHGSVNTSRSSDAHQLAPRVRHAHSPGASQQKAGRHQRGRRARGEGSISWKPIAVPAKKTTLPFLKRKTLKRSRSGNFSQALARASLAQDGSDSEHEKDNGVSRNPVFATLVSGSFHMGDIEGLTKFFRFRLDELTMKPLRPIVTAWIKLLVPRRSGVYGPYHKRLPADAAEDATPPWWPEDVEYNEPSHLSKAALLTLAVDLMLQHRSIVIDETKRRIKGSWTTRLRQAAEYAVDTTPPELYSSSKDADFSVKMRERALTSILPSLFDVAQSYEDYVFQYNLWERMDVSGIPKGKAHTWYAVPRPTRPQAQRKRVCKDTGHRNPQEEDGVDAHSSASGDETEIDETMVREHTRREARREAKQEEVRSTEARQSRAAVKAHTPPSGSTSSRSDYDANTGLKSSHTSSFDQSMSGLVLVDDVKGGSDPTPNQNAEQVPCDMTMLAQPMQYPRVAPPYMMDAFPPSNVSHVFSTPGQQHQHQYADPPFDYGDNSMYNGSFHSPMIGGMAYPYGGTTGHGLSMPVNPSESFNGLPYGYELNQQGPRPYQLDPMCATANQKAF